jgi:hypothetical protein
MRLFSKEPTLYTISYQFKMKLSLIMINTMISVMDCLENAGRLTAADYRRATLYLGLL